MSELWALPVLVGVGVLAGWVNTIAGGGSLVAVPALIWLGLPADVANGTSRVAILAHGATAAWSYRRAGKLEPKQLREVSLPSVLGAIAGAFAATQIPNRVFEPLLLTTLALMGLSMFVSPRALAPSAGEAPRSVRGDTRAFLALLATGFYGGFLQAGVGIMLLFVFSGMLRIDLVRANALKVAVVFAYTIAVVMVFAASAKVSLREGVVLAVGQAAGGKLGVHFSLTRSEAAVKRALLVIIAGSCALLLLRS